MERKVIYYSNPGAPSAFEGLFTKPIMQKPTTKHCRKCGCEDLIELRSIERKRCSNCRRLIYWPLTEGQKPLL